MDARRKNLPGATEARTRSRPGNQGLSRILRIRHWIVTGATGVGKSTTQAAMIGWINDNRRKHIVTLEDPIEYWHDNHESTVTQREIGTDTESFRKGLRQALRQELPARYQGSGSPVLAGRGRFLPGRWGPGCQGPGVHPQGKRGRKGSG